MTEHPFRCPHCQKSFADANGRWQHAKAKHKGLRIRDLRPVATDDEPSMGELAAEAHWNDDPSLDWVRDMFSIPHPAGQDGTGDAS
jgi:hypothetical protein